MWQCDCRFRRQICAAFPIFPRTNLSETLSAALHEKGKWQVVERIDLAAILNEKDLIRAESDTDAILNDPRLRKRLLGADYLVIGGVTVSENP